MDFRSAFHLVSDETRYRIYRILALSGESLCECELVDILMDKQYRISRSLRLLADGGLIELDRKGKLVYAGVSSSHPLSGFFRANTGTEPGYSRDDDRLRWRLDLRSGGGCSIMYRDEFPVNAPLSPEDVLSVLFVCVHNSARSQMAEEYFRRLCPRIPAVSAGIEPGDINPVVARVLLSEGIDIRGKKARGVFDLYRSGRTYSHVVTVCDPAAGELCPSFPGPVVRMNWPFPDPSRFAGTEEEIYNQVARLGAEIHARIEEFVSDIGISDTNVNE